MFCGVVLAGPQLEVEMIDIENIDENSEYYDTAKKAKQQASDSKADTTMKTVIAVLVSSVACSNWNILQCVFLGRSNALTKLDVVVDVKFIVQTEWQMAMATWL